MRFKKCLSHKIEGNIPGKLYSIVGYMYLLCIQTM